MKKKEEITILKEMKGLLFVKKYQILFLIFLKNNNFNKFRYKLIGNEAIKSATSNA